MQVVGMKETSIGFRVRIYDFVSNMLGDFG